MTRVLVTGATGFIGQMLCRQLLAAGHEVSATARNPLDPRMLPGVTLHQVPHTAAPSNWEPILDGVQAIAHLAGRAHIMRELAPDPLAEFCKVNVEGTKLLAKAAIKSGVKRIVALSTIKVNGDFTFTSAFSENDAPAPTDPYAISKWQAEQALAEAAAGGVLETVIIRPPLVYGEGVKGNFLSLLKLCQWSLPLPLAGITNQRSLIYVGNLVDIIINCLWHPAAAGHLFLARDGEDMSTSDLVRRLASALKKPARLFFVGQSFLRFTGRVTGKTGMISRLLDSLCVDDRKIRKTLGWSPHYATDQGLINTAAWFLSREGQ